MCIDLSSPFLESEQSLSSANKELQLQIEAKLSELTAIQAQNDTLEEQLKSVEADYTSYRTHVDGTLQSVQKENESLKVKCSMKDGELEVCVIVCKVLLYSNNYL